jgi:transposase-like protein
MDIERLLQNYNIPYTTEGKHTTKGWVNVHCPFCTGSQDFHLGINKEFPVSHCWRCGSHSTLDVLSRLLNMALPEVQKILRQYKGTGVFRRVEAPKVSIHPFRFPRPNSPLNNMGKRYLARRGFDPEYLEQEWGLLQTGPVSFLDGIPYSNRIVIPINWSGRVVSFQTRDITNQSNQKYMACPMDRERIHHKNIIYGKPEKWKDALIVVEGVFDVWRLGERAAATFGTSFKMEQVMKLAKAAERFFIIFDNETQAQEQARKLAVKLKALGKIVDIETVKGDPGEMKQDDADHLVKQLLKGGK